MKKSKSSTTAAQTGAKKRPASKKSPFATPPHPLGYNYIPEGRPIRATTFAAILPSVIAKYGLGRKLGVERFQTAWHESLAEVFGASRSQDHEVDGGDQYALFTRHTRLLTFRGGVLRVAVASNLLYQELQFQLADLLRAMRARLPNENIKQIKIVVR